ncbi:hypothetical protein AVEN_35439-1 [Araneus ventricosus]|uniref:RNA-directed DNA polymerase from transposon X-element n=1 Tax=Araneus ventricosus TaxID=182803 RepID=A0A4Y2WDT7_ARAVE|nr:hypothetical protein AVEN_35439-1 [Araneus ventricosus]
MPQHVVQQIIASLEECGKSYIRLRNRSPTTSLSLYIDLENSFQENPELYLNLHISKVNRTVNTYFNNLISSTAPNYISPQEVISLIKKINPRKTTDHDGVPNKALRILTLNAVTQFTKIFNRCLLLHHFPDSLKLAHMLMFSKTKQNRKFPGSYRPINLLTNIGKIY